MSPMRIAVPREMLMKSYSPVQGRCNIEINLLAVLEHIE